jgi:2-octaprenylphenol hydroxylase
MESVSEHFDVVIVGGGLVGATLALLLTELDSTQQCRVGIIEAGRFVCPIEGGAAAGFDPRVVALTHASENIFKRINVWDQVEQLRSCAYDGMAVWDSDGTGEIQFSASEANTDHLGTIVENSVLLTVLRSKILDSNKVSILDEITVRQMGPMVATQEHSSIVPDARLLGLDDGRVISAAVVVAADGAQSSLREMAAFSMREWSYNHHAVVTTVQTELPHDYVARQAFMNEGPLAFLPLPSIDGKHFCSIVWSQLPDRADELMALDDEHFCREIAQAIEHRLGRVLHVDKRFAIPLKQRHAKQYVKDRIVLVGDAAHTIHPLAGQGVNLGLLDVAVLAEELLKASEAACDLGSERVLRRYQRRRMGHNLSMMSVMEGFKQLFAETAPPVRFIRNFGMSLLNQHPLIKRPIIMRAMALEGDLPKVAQPL